MNKIKPTKIVLAEDEDLIAMAYQHGLSYHGYVVVVARDGVEALAAVKRERPDLLLLDIIMPHMNGFEVLKALRSDPEFTELLIIVMSNLSQTTDEAEARKLGADDYLVKADHSMSELEARIKKVLNLHKKQPHTSRQVSK